MPLQTMHSTCVASSCSTSGACGTQSGDCKKPLRPKNRSIVAILRIASASRGTIPFQTPQIFSHVSYPSPDALPAAHAPSEAPAQEL
eukprot:5171561-Amphidinium_carterae.1